MVKKNNKKILDRANGFSLIELLVVIFVFSILTVVVTRSIGTSLRGSTKSESVDTVKGNTEYAISVIERQLRNAREIDIAGSNGQSVYFTDENGVSSNFRCQGGANGYLTGVSGRLTSTEVNINCTGSVFQFTASTPTTPASILVTLNATHSVFGGGVSGSSISLSTRIQLRNY